jgi:two-component system, LytTR family, sensor kinase
MVLWVALYLFWIWVFQRRSFGLSRTMTVEFCYLFFIAGNFYFNVLYTIPRFLYRRKFIPFTALLVGGIIAGALLRVPLAAYLNRTHFLQGQPQPGIYVLFSNSLLNIFIWTICLVAAKLIADRIRFQRYIADMEKEKARTELDFLKAQFNPHFLFNSINSIYGHIDKKNASARTMLLTFSDMLRYQLYDCNTERIGIDKELAYIRNYIALQRTRKEENLVVRLHIGDNIKGFTIAPLLFIAFIENCFKYVSDNDACENRVEISFTRTGDLLTFKAFNTKEHRYMRPVDHKGIGIANVKRRLELLYPGKYDLAIEDLDQSYETTLNIPLS